ncbi:hypothetical protein U1Q18_013955, partial [Sarracenia purpurea var. burkii]
MAMWKGAGVAPVVACLLPYAMRRLLRWHLMPPLVDKKNQDPNLQSPEMKKP